MASIDEDLCFLTAVELIKVAGSIFKEGFHCKKNVYSKFGNADIVTEFDKKIEEFLISKLSTAFPAHKFIGEETQENSTAWSNDPTWIIDPIDGTTNFVHGITETCISVALAVNKIIIIGVIYNPISDQMFTAQKGKGSFLNGKKIEVSKTTDLSKAVIYMELSLATRPEFRENMFRQLYNCIASIQGIRATGSSAFGLCHVACGTMDILLTNGLKCWDVAAGVLIVQEAGGHILDPSGSEFDLMSNRILAASTEQLAKQLICVLHKGTRISYSENE